MQSSLHVVSLSHEHIETMLLVILERILTGEDYAGMAMRIHFVHSRKNDVTTTQIQRV